MHIAELKLQNFRDNTRLKSYNLIAPSIQIRGNPTVLYAIDFVLNGEWDSLERTKTLIVHEQLYSRSNPYTLVELTFDNSDKTFASYRNKIIFKKSLDIVNNIVTYYFNGKSCSEKFYYAKLVNISVNWNLSLKNELEKFARADDKGRLKVFNDIFRIQESDFFIDYQDSETCAKLLVDNQKDINATLQPFFQSINALLDCGITKEVLIIHHQQKTKKISRIMTKILQIQQQLYLEEKHLSSSEGRLISCNRKLQSSKIWTKSYELYIEKYDEISDLCFHMSSENERYQHIIEWTIFDNEMHLKSLPDSSAGNKSMNPIPENFLEQYRAAYDDFLETFDRSHDICMDWKKRQAELRFRRNKSYWNVVGEERKNLIQEYMRKCEVYIEHFSSCIDCIQCSMNFCGNGIIEVAKSTLWFMRNRKELLKILRDLDDNIERRLINWKQKSNYKELQIADIGIITKLKVQMIEELNLTICEKDVLHGLKNLEDLSLSETWKNSGLDKKYHGLLLTKFDDDGLTLQMKQFTEHINMFYHIVESKTAMRQILDMLEPTEIGQKYYFIILRENEAESTDDLVFFENLEKAQYGSIWKTDFYLNKSVKICLNNYIIFRVKFGRVFIVETNSPEDIQVDKIRGEIQNNKLKYKLQSFYNLSRTLKPLNTFQYAKEEEDVEKQNQEIVEGFMNEASNSKLFCCLTDSENFINMQNRSISNNYALREFELRKLEFTLMLEKLVHELDNQTGELSDEEMSVLIEDVKAKKIDAENSARECVDKLNEVRKFFGDFFPWIRQTYLMQLHKDKTEAEKKVKIDSLENEIKLLRSSLQEHKKNILSAKKLLEDNELEYAQFKKNKILEFVRFKDIRKKVNSLKNKLLQTELDLANYKDDLEEIKTKFVNKFNSVIEEEDEQPMSLRYLLFEAIAEEIDDLTEDQKYTLNDHRSGNRELNEMFQGFPDRLSERKKLPIFEKYDKINEEEAAFVVVRTFESIFTMFVPRNYSAKLKFLSPYDSTNNRRKDYATLEGLICEITEDGNVKCILSRKEESFITAALYITTIFLSKPPFVILNMLDESLEGYAERFYRLLRTQYKGQIIFATKPVCTLELDGLRIVHNRDVF